MKFILGNIAIVLFVSSICFSQQSDLITQSNQTKGSEIIRKARHAIGVDKKGEISSYFNKIGETLLIQNLSLESFEEVSFILPDKIQAVYGSDSPRYLRLTRTWNGEKYNSVFESESPSGQRTVKDVTAREKRPLSIAAGNVISKETAAALERSRRADPLNILKTKLWTSLFPLLLSHPFEKNIEFNYIGKAESEGKTANVVDVKPIGEKTYRLFFDTETNYLLLMIVSQKVNNGRFVGDVETKYYFSERKVVNGVLIPKKIKVEKKATPKGKAPVVKLSIVEILDFKLNPTLDEKKFNIK